MLLPTLLPQVCPLYPRPLGTSMPCRPDQMPLSSQNFSQSLDSALVLNFCSSLRILPIALSYSYTALQRLRGVRHYAWIIETYSRDLWTKLSLSEQKPGCTLGTLRSRVDLRANYFNWALHFLINDYPRCQFKLLILINFYVALLF